MKNKAGYFGLVIMGILAVLLAALILYFVKASEEDNSDALKNDRIVIYLQDKYSLIVEKFGNVINSFNEGNKSEYAVVSPDSTSVSVQEIEEEYNKLLRMDAVEFYNYLNEVYETDVNYRMENLPYFEGEMIEENEGSNTASDGYFVLVKD